MREGTAVGADTAGVARVTLVYALCHFVVDLACVTTLLGSVSATLHVWDAHTAALAIVAYDLVAFCLQLPIGTLLDALGRRASLGAALASLALVATGVVLGTVPVGAACMGAVALVALGNALFHSVGGIEVLSQSRGRMAPSGEFISTGALGVFVGGLAGVNRWAGAPALLLALLLACAALVPRVTGGLASKTGTLRLGPSPAGWLAILLLAVTVALRSYAGSVMAFPWKADAGLATLAVLSVVAGKAVGGRMADVLGALVTSTISLGGAAVLFWRSWDSVVAGVSATFLFNFTMAITLCSLARLLPQARGTAFGIASFSLAVGALPALMGVRVASGPILCALSLVSLATLAAALLLVARLHLVPEAREGAVPLSGSGVSRG